MSLKIIPQSLNLYMDDPTERLSGQTMADLQVLAIVVNEGRTTIGLTAQEISLSLISTSGQLLLVETAQQLNGKWLDESLEIKSGSQKPLTITFCVLAKMLGKISDVGSLGLDIGYDAVTVSKSLIKVLPAPGRR